jgi:glycosyltransferase involved in cell wall biosynthesis
MYTIKRGGSYDRFKMMIESFLEKKCEVHCLSLTPIQIDHFFYHNHVVYFPLKKVDGLIARLAVLSLFPPWAIWVGWRNKIDLVIAFGFLYAFIQGFSKWSLKRPMITLIRGSLTFGSKMQNSPKYFLYLNRIIENIGIRFSDRIITNNISAREEILKRLGKGKNIDVQVLYNNIPPMNNLPREDIFQKRDEYGLSRDAKVLVTAGILNRGKNIETLISCLSKMEVKNVFALIVGDGSTEVDARYKDYLRKLAKKLEVSEKIIFTGWLEKEDLCKIYLSSDLFVLPSLSEGMPNAMLEALGSGLPCIGSNVAGVKDILQYDELLFDPLDERALVHKIRQTFSDGQVLERIRKLCQERKKVFEFDWRERLFQMVTVGFNLACKKP